MAAKAKVASNTVEAPAQGDSDWGVTAEQVATPAPESEAQPTAAGVDQATPLPDVHEDEVQDGKLVEATGDEYEAATPDSFADALKELARVQDLPERNGGDAKRKERALNKIQHHVHMIQQGTPAPNLDATDRKQSDATTRHAEFVQWENLCRQFPLVKRFNDEYEALVNENNKLRKKI